MPEKTIQLIRSFLDRQGMRARVRLDGVVLEEISVQNGLRQGRCMAPVLFNLYASLAVERWLARVDGVGGVGLTVRYKYDGKLFNLYASLAVERWLARVDGVGGVGLTVRYKYDGKLFRRYTRNAHERKITECQFADDTAFLASTRSGAERMALEYQRTGQVEILA